MSAVKIKEILRSAIDEFDVSDVCVNLPEWVHVLNDDNEIKMHYISKIKESTLDVNKIKDVNNIINYYKDSPFINSAYISSLDIGEGRVTLNLESSDELYNETLKSIMGTSNVDKATIIKIFTLYNESKSSTDAINDALKQASATGYGIVSPSLKDMNLATPEIIRQGSRYGVRLKATAKSIHMLKVDVESTFEPIIGSEAQAKELIDFIMRDYKNNPDSIWESEIFGRSLENIVREGINSKLSLMKDSTRYKLTNTVAKLVNKGSDKLITIVI